MLLGFALGLLLVSSGGVIYYWAFAPLAPLFLAVVLRIVANYVPRAYPIAEGALAVALLAAVAAIVFLGGIAINLH
jgi:hypothetical protein